MTLWVVIIKGTAIATKEYGTDIVLVGPVEKIETELAKYDKPDANIEIVATNEYLAEGEHPGQ